MQIHIFKYFVFVISVSVISLILSASLSALICRNPIARKKETASYSAFCALIKV